MNKNQKLLIDLFGEIPTPTDNPDEYLININRTRVTYTGGASLMLTGVDTGAALMVKIDAPLRDLRDAMNFVMFAGPGDADLYDLEREILKRDPTVQFSHGKIADGAPMDSFATNKHAWIKLSREDNLFTLTYWGGELDGTDYAATLTGAANRFIEMTRFAAELNAETAESIFWEAQN
jgi:hypothetical protein